MNITLDNPPRLMRIVLVIMFSVTMARATNHIIKFGGTLGFNYSPSQLTVAVGDSITWQGTFSAHPLSSTSVPAGAATFHNGSGSSFTYPVLVAGAYSYECDIHGSSGMKGTFTALVTGIQSEADPARPAVFRLIRNYPNPFNARTRIEFELPAAQKVDLKVYAITGARVATLVDGFLPAGQFHVIFDAAHLATGIYFYRLSGEHLIDTKRMILVK